MKKSNRFDEVKVLAASCSKSELEIIDDLLSSRNKTKDKSSSITKAFIHLISRKPAITLIDALKILKLKKDSQEFSNLLSDAETAILDGLSDKTNLMRPGTFSNHFRNHFLIGQKLVQAKLLLAKGALVPGEKILRDVINRSVKYEKFADAQEAVNLIRLVQSASSTRKTYEKLEKELNGIIEKRNELEKAKEIYIESRFLKNNKPNEWAENSKRYIKALSEYTTTDSGKYFYLRLKYEQEVYVANYQSAIGNAESLITLLDGSHALQSKERSADAMMDLAYAMAMNRLYSKAKVAYKKSAQLRTNGSPEHYTTLKKITFLDFYIGYNRSLKDDIARQAKSKHTLRIPNAYLQQQYFLAYSNFLDGNFKLARNIIAEEIKHSSQISTEMQLAINYLLFMIGTELIKSDQSALKDSINIAIRNLQRIKSSDILSKRQESIIELLEVLSANDFDFVGLAMSKAETLNQLSKGNLEMEWKVFGPEIIPMQTWIAAKSEKLSLREAVA